MCVRASKHTLDSCKLWLTPTYSFKAVSNWFWFFLGYSRWISIWLDILIKVNHTLEIIFFILIWKKLTFPTNWIKCSRIGILFLYKNYNETSWYQNYFIYSLSTLSNIDIIITPWQREINFSHLILCILFGSI